MLQGSTRFEVNSVDAAKRGFRLYTLTESRDDRVGADEPYRRGGGLWVERVSRAGTSSCGMLGL